MMRRPMLVAALIVMSCGDNALVPELIGDFEITNNTCSLTPDWAFGYRATVFPREESPDILQLEALSPRNGSEDGIGETTDRGTFFVQIGVESVNLACTYDCGGAIVGDALVMNCECLFTNSPDGPLQTFGCSVEMGRTGSEQLPANDG